MICLKFYVFLIYALIFLSIILIHLSLGTSFTCTTPTLRPPTIVPIPKFSDPSATCCYLYSMSPRSLTLYSAFLLSAIAILASLGVIGIPCLLIFIIIPLMVDFGPSSRLSKSYLEIVKATSFH